MLCITLLLYAKASENTTMLTKIYRFYDVIITLLCLCESAEKGELVEISEIARAYQSAVDDPVSSGQIYFRPIRAVGEDVQNVVKRYSISTKQSIQPLGHCPIIRFSRDW